MTSILFRFGWAMVEHSAYRMKQESRFYDYLNGFYEYSLK